MSSTNIAFHCAIAKVLQGILPFNAVGRTKTQWPFSTFRLSAILLVSLAGQVAAQSGLYQNPVPWSRVTVFENARCTVVSTDTVSLVSGHDCCPYPSSFRTDFPSKIFSEADGAVPYEVYFAASRDSQLYLVQKGFCRNISTLVAIPRPGWFFVRYYHQGKPALVQINARRPKMLVTCDGPCELHE